MASPRPSWLCTGGWPPLSAAVGVRHAWSAPGGRLTFGVPALRVSSRGAPTRWSPRSFLVFFFSPRGARSLRFPWPPRCCEHIRLVRPMAAPRSLALRRCLCRARGARCVCALLSVRRGAALWLRGLSRLMRFSPWYRVRTPDWLACASGMTADDRSSCALSFVLLALAVVLLAPTTSLVRSVSRAARSHRPMTRPLRRRRCLPLALATPAGPWTRRGSTTRTMRERRRWGCLWPSAAAWPPLHARALMC